MERLKERLATAQRVLGTLRELAGLPRPSPIERDAAIQRFEYTFEACWRAVQRYLLVVDGISAGSPKAGVRASREVGLLSDEQAVVGLEMVDDRNLTVHTYNEAVAQRIYGNLQPYATLLADWLSAMELRAPGEWRIGSE